MDEYISRELLKQTIKLVDENVPNLLAFLDMIPAEDVAPIKHGYWVDKAVNGILTIRECSVCRSQSNIVAFKANLKYCPNCGAKMDGKDKENG